MQLDDFKESVKKVLNNKDGKIIFLHGFLGSGQEWQKINELLKDKVRCSILTPDLPYHGSNTLKNLTISYNLENIHEYFQNYIGKGPVLLWGYSLGGRLAMKLLSHDLKNNTHNIAGIIIESSHPGLKDENIKVKRLHHDKIWSNRFALEEIKDVLKDWYQQGVFCALSDLQKEYLIKTKCHNDSKSLAHALLNFSLGKQEDLSNIFSSSVPICYLYGQFDEKFTYIANEIKNTYPNTVVKECLNAGHNIHAFHPEEIINTLI